jgi:hypothetical protein
MGFIMKLRKIIAELKRVDNADIINSAKINKSTIQVKWDNGVIFTEFGPNVGLNTIMFILNFSNNLLVFFSMDDRSDFRFVGRLQNAVKDLIKSNIIDLKWKIQIASKDSTNKNLTGGSIKNLLAYNATFDKNIPVCFHGTTDLDIDSIKRFGIVPPAQMKKFGKNFKQNFDGYYTERSSDNIYLSIDIDVAKNYAVHASEKNGGKPIVLMIKNLDTANILTDDDILNNVGMAAFLTFLTTGKKNRTYIDSIRINSQFAYKGRIPASKITKIMKV